MSQTKPMPIDQLVRLPWSFEGPVADPDGGFVIRIAELPGFVVAAETRDQVLVVEHVEHVDAKLYMPLPEDTDVAGNRQVRRLVEAARQEV